MRSPVQVFRDWSLVKKQKAGFLDALRQTPAGACISVTDPANPITARALIEILQENPNTIEMMDYGFSVTIMRKVSMVQSMTSDSYRAMRANHQILSADSVAEFDLKNKDQLPLRKFRDGVPDNVNDDGAHTGDVKLILP
jgi:hypothetical protein